MNDIINKSIDVPGIPSLNMAQDTATQATTKRGEVSNHVEN